MNSAYNNFVYMTENNEEMNYYNSFENYPHQYMNYVPNNIPMLYEQNKQKKFSDFIDCEIYMEDNLETSNYKPNFYRTRSGSQSSRRSNNPINGAYGNKLRSKSPQYLRKNNYGFNNYNNSFSSNSSNIAATSLSNYSIGSYSSNNSPILGETPVINKLVNIVPVQYGYNNINNNLGQNPFIKNENNNIYNTPNKSQFIFPGTLSASTIYHKKNINAYRNMNNNLGKNITNFQNSPQQNSQLLFENLLNNSGLNKLNNNNIPAQNNSTIYRSQIQKMNLEKKLNIDNNENDENDEKKSIKKINYFPTTNSSNNSPKIISKQNNNQHILSPIEKNYNEGSFININSNNKRKISDFFQSCSNTHVYSASLNNSNSNLYMENSKGNSSKSDLDISDFNAKSVFAGKRPSLVSGERNIQEVKNDLRTKENSAINLLNNNKNSNPTLNNKNNPINNIYPKNPNNSLINHKSNLYSAMNQDQRPLDDFSEYMFEQINKIRVNPKSFVDKFKKAKDCIKRDKKGNLYYSGKMKVALYQGKEAFEEAILSLEKMKPMKPLIYKKDLCIKLSNSQNDFKSGDYLRKKINELIKSGIKVRAFWRDIIKDPEINFLLMIVDDNPIRRGAKRKDVLNPEMKYIGINSGTCGEYFICYTVLSDE